MAPPRDPITVALVDDYDVVLLGVAAMLEPYSDRVRVVELATNSPVGHAVDVVLYDTFAQAEVDQQDVAVIIGNDHAKKVVVYTWAFDPRLLDRAKEQGIDGYLSKGLPARELVDALERVHAGEIVVSQAPSRTGAPSGSDWPGRPEGLTDRESEIMALITQGRSNADIAELTYLSPNTVKSYIRNVYRKLGLAGRTQAVLWGVRHGFSPDHHSIDVWRG